MFRSLSVSSWRQFDHVDIDFHPKLTVLTGANGSGKTTLLNILNRHFKWDLVFVATPRLSKKRARQYFFSDIHTDTEDDSADQIGRLIYRDGHEADILVPKQASPPYHLRISNQQNVPGVFLPSHRPVYGYQPVEQIPTRLNAHEQLLDSYLQELRNLYSFNTKLQSPSWRLKSALISLAVFGYGNQVVQADPGALSTFEGFESVLRIVLPPDIGFRRLSIRMPEVVFEADSGDFSLDAASGGISALVDIAWQVYMCSLLNDQFVVVADEPENHLHPELQRSVLPNLIRAFPSTQFVAATHNPFIVGSVPDSAVYVLNFLPAGRVVSDRLDLINKAGSSNEILRDALGLPNPVPIWVEDEVEGAVTAFSGQPITADSLRALRSQLEAVGLGRFFPDAVERLVPPQQER